MPPTRTNCGSSSATRRSRRSELARVLAQLVELGDLKGDLHTHTSWSSDGKNSLAEMVESAVARGYAYYAVTDHSHYLRGDRFEAQLEEIEALQERVKPFILLKGIEANIRANGEVDVEDELLARLDWVVASVHAARETSPTERVFAAMEHPYVDCIGHLTGRKITNRGPSEVDVERVIEKALETGTFLEINSQPDRLDLRDVHARAAKEAGLKLVVSSDAHQILAQGYLELGIGQARRGWLTKEDVLNTRTWPQIRKLQKKRPR
jgi:DNA polymerase (family 10)